MLLSRSLPAVGFAYRGLCTIQSCKQHPDCRSLTSNKQFLQRRSAQLLRLFSALRSSVLWACYPANPVVSADLVTLPAAVLLARDKFLKPDGALYPSHARMYLAPMRTSSAASRVNDFQVCSSNDGTSSRGSVGCSGSSNSKCRFTRVCLNYQRVLVHSITELHRKSLSMQYWIMCRGYLHPWGGHEYLGYV
eukprot:GHUV01047734.1.p1 GENE.GHUV01047734.1~~GHUV01047734.1.p1  ORF type:complete len:192 (-),score=29.56 GHUV01047734.1:147-722(-)